MKRIFRAILLLVVFSLYIAPATVFAECIEGNCRNGYGTFSFPDGQKYVGQFKNGKRHGQGSQTWPLGDKYVGQWADGKKHGSGTYTWPSGRKRVGRWENNAWIDSAGRPFHGRYDGGERILSKQAIRALCKIAKREDSEFRETFTHVNGKFEDFYPDIVCNYAGQNIMLFQMSMIGQDGISTNMRYLIENHPQVVFNAKDPKGRTVMDWLKQQVLLCRSDAVKKMLLGHVEALRAEFFFTMLREEFPERADEFQIARLSCEIDKTCQ